MEFDEAEATKATDLTDAELEAEFETFWKQCPRAVSYGKAQKIGGAMRSQDPGGTTLPVALGGRGKEMPDARWPDGGLSTAPTEM
jgi:hypothetical protein